MTAYPNDEFKYKMDNCDDSISYYSDLQVCRSGGGFYIGRMCMTIDPELGEYMEPGSRESGYYTTSEQAQRELDENSFDWRDSIENQFMMERLITND